MRVHRGSSAPIAMACPASVNPEPGEMLLDSVNPAGLSGSAVHKIAEPIVKTGEIPTDWQAIAKSYGIIGAGLTDVQVLSYAAKAFWNEYGSAFENPETEKELTFDLAYDLARRNTDMVKLSCHLDVFDLQERVALELDWKTSRLDIDYSAQMLFYAWVICLNHDQVEEVTSMVVFLRDRTANIQKWTREQIRNWAERYIDDVIRWDGRTYRPGAHCAYCRRWVNCPAQSAMVTQTHQDILEAEINLPAEPDKLVNLYERIGALSKRIDDVKDAIKARAEQTGGCIQGSDKRLQIVISNKDTVDARAAWPILQRELSVDELAEATRVNKTDILKAVGDHAPRGKKKGAKDAFLEELRDAEAITTKEIRSLRVMQGQEKEILIDE